MTKIIIFSKHFYPDNFKINTIAKELVRRGYHVDVLTSKPSYNYKNIIRYKNNLSLHKRIWNRVNIFYLPVFRKKNYSFFNISLNYFTHLLSCFFYSHFLIKKKYELIFVFGTSPIFQSLPAVYLSFLIKKPVILWVQDLWPESLKDTGYIKNKYILSIIKLFVKINYLLTDLILVQSENFKKKIKKDFKLKKKIITYYNLSELKFQKFKRNKNKKIVITYAGNFGNAQDFQTLFKVLQFSEIKKNFYIKLIGSGKKYYSLKNYILKNKLNESIKIQKYISERKLSSILLKSDALYLTLNKGEALNSTIPGKFQTYLSFGKPIISNTIGASKDIIENSKIGFSNHPGDYKTLYNNLIKLKKMSLTKKKNIYKRSHLLYKKHFELHQNINNLENIFKKILNKNDTQTNIL